MKNAIVTGGAQGIGKAISMKLIKEGVFVFVLDIDAEAVEDFKQEVVPHKFYKTFVCDAGGEASLKVALDECLQGPEGISYLVNNAAISANKAVEELSLDEWNRVLAVNLSSFFLTAKYLSPALRVTKGAIVNLCSTRAFMSEPGTEAYSASKGGVYGLTHALAMSLQPEVRVNCISPGWIDTTAWQKKSKRKVIDWAAEHHLQHPAGRIGEPEDIADLAWYLLSDQAGFITGQNFIVDGGMTRKMIYL
ncbi:MAG: SDR family oxidoreductase [Bacteroides sp.]|jgi:NAD(P)-dependent dehydrogenase (short-subunit alcohol dehydrogenase family)|nr:SDR family oxidoreductase [Bacteroides sp.]